MSPRANKRGSMYVAVLMIAMVVSLLGVTGLHVAQRNLRAAVDAEDMARARFCAESAVELAAVTCALDAAWLAKYVDRGWIGPFALDRGSCSWRIDTAPEGAELGLSDVYQVYGRGRAGRAARVYSVRAYAHYEWPDNLLSNAGFETGLAAWDAHYCDGAIMNDDPAEGDRYLRVTDRAAEWAGPRQEVTDALHSGDDLYVSAQLRSPSGSQAMKLTLEYVASMEGRRWLVLGVFTAGSDWTRCEGSGRAYWSGALQEAYIYAETWGSRDDFDIDDVEFYVAPDETIAPRLVPLAGTWRAVDAAP